MELLLFAVISLLVLALLFVGISTVFRMVPRTAQRKLPVQGVGWTGGSHYYGTTSEVGNADLGDAGSGGSGGDGGGGS
ncbi:hypothetical protein ABN028_15530 [Actinopolymorpha sp. B17G11]|uniref:hypothetical protein n=1 Tax=unclassified Actinopolymorpha TaxID=2627063 RepID=UPI0032D9A884